MSEENTAAVAQAAAQAAGESAQTDAQTVGEKAQADAVVAAPQPVDTSWANQVDPNAPAWLTSAPADNDDTYVAPAGMGGDAE